MQARSNMEKEKTDIDATEAAPADTRTAHTLVGAPKQGKHEPVVAQHTVAKGVLSVLFPSSR